MAGHAILLRAPFAGGEIAYEVIGPEGAPWLVLCHGMGLDRANMLPLARHLAGPCRVLVWDMPGHGESAAQAFDHMDQFADACEAVMAAAGVEWPALVGFSFGGVLAQYLVARDPGRYRALVAYGCYAPFHQAPVAPPLIITAILARYRLQRWPRICADFAKNCAITPQGQAEVLRAASATTKPVFLAMVRALLTSFVPRPDVRFGVPLFLLRGARDSNGPALQQGALGLRASHPRATERIVPDAGHCAHDDQPAATAQAIGDFLRKVLHGASA